MRLLVLYLRSRQAPLATTGAVGSVVSLWQINQATDRRMAGLIALLAVVAATAAAGPGLAELDVDLDRTAVIAWPLWRATHVITAGIAVVSIVTATALTGHQLAPAGQVLRDATGMAGLLALGAASLGAGRAWILPLAWTLLGQIVALRLWSPPASAYQQALTWMHQPTASTAATVTAVALGVTGILPTQSSAPAHKAHPPGTPNSPAPRSPAAATPPPLSRLPVHPPPLGTHSHKSQLATK
jgi:hypothetical protein